MLEQPASSMSTASADFIARILAAGAFKAVAHGIPLRKFGRRLDQDLLAVRAIELAQGGVQPLRIPLLLPLHAPPEVDALDGNDEWRVRGPAPGSPR